MGIRPISGRIPIEQSGREDLNLRLSGPKPDAVARLRHAPVNYYFTNSIVCWQLGEDATAGDVLSRLLTHVS